MRRSSSSCEGMRRAGSEGKETWTACHQLASSRFRTARTSPRWKGRPASAHGI